jgi:hypothetical protein
MPSPAAMRSIKAPVLPLRRELENKAMALMMVADRVRHRGKVGTGRRSVSRGPRIAFFQCLMMLELGFTADRLDWANAAKWTKPAAAFGLANQHLCVNAVGTCLLARREKDRSIRLDAKSSRNEMGARLFRMRRASRRQRRQAQDCPLRAHPVSPNHQLPPRYAGRTVCASSYLHSGSFIKSAVMATSFAPFERK